MLASHTNVIYVYVSSSSLSSVYEFTYLRHIHQVRVLIEMCDKPRQSSLSIDYKIYILK